MIGQKNLLNKINSYTIDTFPRSTILIGEKGIGKHTLIDYIKENVLKLPSLDISDKLSDEYIDAIYRNPNPYIYIINLDLITEKEQNVILKFVEEPLNNSFIILLCQNKTFVLNTILNRCFSFEFESYTKDELKQFLPIEDTSGLVLNILRTPGKIKDISIDNLKDMLEVCNKIIDKFSVAKYSSILTITNKINFKDNYDKFDLEIFLDVLAYSLYNRFLLENNKNIYSMYKTLILMRKRLLDKRLNRELFFNSLLTELWRSSNGN